ncbi:MAG: alpha-E domain-containing protein [Gloeomargarita sp. HHBFW_bins_162]
MLSRVANSVYWLNRYIERAENVARFVDVNLNLILDLPNHTMAQWEPLVSVTGDFAIFQERYGSPTQEQVIQFLTFDYDYANSIVSCLYTARENARSIREIISSEMWQEVNSFYWFVQGAAERSQEVDLNQFFQEVKLASHRFAGVMDATMSHNEAWHFGQMGRLLERADKTTRIMDVKYYVLLPSVQDVGTTLDEIQWMALLKSASAYEMYRKRGRHLITPRQVAEFLLLNREFPRSVQFCLRQMQESLYRITGTALDDWNMGVERRLGRLCAELEYITIDEIIQQGLHEFLDHLQREFNRLDDAIFRTFFAVNLDPVDHGAA